MVWSCQGLCGLLQGNRVNQLPSFEGLGYVRALAVSADDTVQKSGRKD